VTLALADAEAAIVREILARHLPAGVEVAVFGSRAGGRVKPASDLDLALQGDGPLPLALLAELAEAFDESALPWTVDLVDLAGVSAAFAQIIRESAVALDYR
jgi:uncharacterized protein